MAATETSGIWGQAVEIALPINAAANSGAYLTGISCSSVGNCTAAGSYLSIGPPVMQQAMVATEISGVWGQAVEIAAPINAATVEQINSDGAHLTGISCSSVGNCTVTGRYIDSSSAQQAMVATETSGVWGQAVEIALPSNAVNVPQLDLLEAEGNPNNGVGLTGTELTGISCSSVGNCTATGTYSISWICYTTCSSSQQAMAATETSGIWRQAVEVAAPNNAYTGANAGAPSQVVDLKGISCSSAGNCTAAGRYRDSSSYEQAQAMAATETSGIWGQATEVAAPSNAAGDVEADLAAISCSAVDNCTATGYYLSGSNQVQIEAMAATETVSAPPPPPPPPPPPAPTHGYWLVGSDGGIFTFGSAQFYGSTGSLHLQRPVVGIVPTADRGGYWLDASDGGVFSYGDTQFYGSIPGLGLHPAGSGLPNSLNAPLVGMVPSIDDGGYFMVARDGGVFAFGDAHFAGSCPGIGGCSGSAVAVMPDHSGNGYWVVTSSGSVYTFGDAPYFGAPGHGMVTSAVATPDGKGYWVLLSDGEVFPYGDAANLGSPSSANFNGLDAANAIFATSDGAGYWVSSALGAVFNYGDAPNDGGMSGTHLNGSIIAATGF